MLYHGVAELQRTSANQFIKKRGAGYVPNNTVNSYLAVLIPSVTHLIRYREIPSSRRLSAGLGVSGVLLCPVCAGFLCELLTSLLSIGLFLLIIIGGIGLMVKSIFR